MVAHSFVHYVQLRLPLRVCRLQLDERGPTFLLGAVFLEANVSGPEVNQSPPFAESATAHSSNEYCLLLELLSPLPQDNIQRSTYTSPHTVFIHTANSANPTCCQHTNRTC